MGNTQHVTDSKHKVNEPAASLDNENFSFGASTLKNLTISSENTLAVNTNQTAGKSGGNKRKGRTKDKKKDDTFSYRKNFSTDESDSKTDMYEISPDDDFDQLYLQTPSPAVPELIVDVLKAEVSSDRSDGYSTIGSLDMNFLNANSAETTDDNDQNQHKTTVLNNNELVNNDEKQNTDSGLNYPIIFRRSKKDPGSKQYNELVKELSSVLKKRSETARAQSMHEETSANTLGVDLKTVSVERMHNSKSSENVNVFANKSLLNKLENHIANRNLANKLAKEERQENRTEDIRKINTSSDYALRNVANHSETKSGNTMAMSDSYNDIDSLYSKPLKNKANVTNSGVTGTKSEPANKVAILYDKRATTEPRYDHPANFSTETTRTHFDLSFRPDTTTFFQPDISAYEYDSRKSASRISDSSTDTSKQDSKMTSTKETISVYQQYNNREQQVNAQSLHLAHPRGETENANFNTRHAITHDFKHATSNLHGGSSDVNTVRYRLLTPTANMPSTVFAVASKGHSAGDTWTDGQGHGTTITISGQGLSKRNQFMKSEPNLTLIDSLNSDRGSSNHTGNRHDEASRRPDLGIVLPSSSSSLARSKHYVANHYHYRSLDNLLSDSFEKSGNVYVVNSANTSFLHNHSYDVSFDHESFNEDDDFQGYQSDHHSDASDSLNSHVIKVNVGSTYFGSNVSNMHRHTIATEDRFRPVNVIRTSDNGHGYSSLPRTASMTTIMDTSKDITVNPYGMGDSSMWPSSFTEHSRSLDRQITVPRATSHKSTSSSSSSHASSRSKIARSQTLERNNLQHQRHHAHPHNHLYIKHSPRRNTSFTSNPGSPKSDDSSAAASSPDVPASKLYIVVPPQPHQARVPDLIVDHQQTQKQQQHYGSPFLQEIGEGILPTVNGEGLHKGEEDKPAHFYIDARNLRGTPSVQVDGPNAIAKCSIDPLKDGQYKVTYIPVEVGLFDVYVRWNDRELPGSPFHPQVVDSRKVKVIGGWQHYMDGQERIHLVVGEEKKIPFDTSEAGPGHLRAEVKSPSSLLPVEVDDSHKGRNVVKFTPREEGNHYIYLHWSDHPLVNSPYLGYATGGVADPSKVWLSGRGLKEAVVKEEAEFTIDGSQAGPGEPDVELTGVRAEIPVITTPLGGGKHRCTYIPVIPGAYLLNISWNGRQLRGAPYKVNVIGASYPDRVVVNGDGLKGGLLGQSLSFQIDTRKAGPGELTALCKGPTKVAYCELQDHHDGIYSLVIRPQESGRHELHIKYGGENVQGSPYKFKIAAQPDASKVRVSGPGVEHGILANFQSQFIVETKGAGAGQLTVRIRGPKGAFQVEMYRESQKDRTILCRYYPSVTGLYIISVRWSGVDVPGSPFQVHILDTQQELEQVLHEASFTGSGHHHFVSPNSGNFHNSSSFHNSSMSSGNQIRYSSHQNGHHHNVSRNSSYYQYN